MKVRLAAILVLTIALPFIAAADELEDWCAQVQKASSIVICSDAQLRSETIKRQKVLRLLRND